MEEVTKRVHEYRGFKIKTYASGNGEWLIYNTLGKPVGTSYNNPQEARDYIDAILKA